MVGQRQSPIVELGVLALEAMRTLTTSRWSAFT